MNVEQNKADYQHLEDCGKDYCLRCDSILQRLKEEEQAEMADLGDLPLDM